MPKIDPNQFGVSFSIKQCRNFGIDPVVCLDWLIAQGFRRFRLMSYWNEHEKVQGKYDFTALDKQITQITAAGGEITLCLGARQPRWPENHWPDWAWAASQAARSAALLHYIEVVVERYKHEPAIVSYQLENEALLQAFGRNPEVDRKRLRAEFALVKRLDPGRPVIMSTSTSWGIPWRQPIPDIVGFSYYRVVYNAQRGYTTAFHHPWLHKLRHRLITAYLNKPVFVHELQLEPWGPTAIWKMSREEQDRSMSAHDITTNINLAKQIDIPPIDLWGGEWWYWRSVKQKDVAFLGHLHAALGSYHLTKV